MTEIPLREGLVGSSDEVWIPSATNLIRVSGFVHQTDLIADFPAQWSAAFAGNTGREHPRGETSGLKDHHQPDHEDTMIKKHLGHLRGFPGTRGRLNDDPTMQVKLRQQLRFEFENGKIGSLHKILWRVSKNLAPVILNEVKNRRARGMLKLKPGEKPFAEWWATRNRKRN